VFHVRNPAIGFLILALGGAPLAAQEDARDWARDCDIGDRRSESHCEVREYTLRAVGSLRVDAHPNGGIRVYAWDRNEVKVVARVAAWARSAEAARELAGTVRVETGDREIRSTGPDTRTRSGWYVSYDIWAPGRTDLRLSSSNGGLAVEGIHGRLDLETTNGGISLRAVGGDVSAETTNGGINVVLEGRRWEGEGLRAGTTNGAVRLTVPDGYNADFEASTVHGGMDFDFPITIRGRINRRITTRLGDGGALISLETTNGGVAVRRR
jgi:hypothetical protein